MPPIRWSLVGLGLDRLYRVLVYHLADRERARLAGDYLLAHSHDRDVEDVKRAIRVRATMDELSIVELVEQLLECGGDELLEDALERLGAFDEPRTGLYPAPPSL